MVENLAGMLKVLGLTSSTREKKIRQKKGKKKKNFAVSSHSSEDSLPRDHVEKTAWGGGDRKGSLSSPLEHWACRQESQDSRKGHWGGQEGTLPSQAGALLIWHRNESTWRTESGGRGSVPRTCTRELGGSEVSLPTLLPGKLTHLAYLTPPPSSRQRKRREREKG